MANVGNFFFVLSFLVNLFCFYLKGYKWVMTFFLMILLFIPIYYILNRVRPFSHVSCSECLSSKRAKLIKLGVCFSQMTNFLGRATMKLDIMDRH